MSKKIASALALLLVASGSSFGAMPLITDDTGTQGSGGNQLEVAYGEDKSKDPSTGLTDKALMPSLTYTRGVTDTIDVFLGIGWVENKYGDVANPNFPETSGSSNPSLGAKWRFLETERKTSLALKAVYGHPVSEEKQNKDLGDGEASWDGTLILSQELGFGSAHANIGMGRVGVKNGDDEDTTHVSVAPMLDLGETAKLVFDFGQDTSKPKNGTKVTSVYWEVGGIYAPSKSVDLAIGFIQTKEKDSDIKTDTITGGVTWRF